MLPGHQVWWSWLRGLPLRQPLRRPESLREAVRPARQQLRKQAASREEPQVPEKQAPRALPQVLWEPSQVLRQRPKGAPAFRPWA
jgi:hypothetical protein